jgi:signal transduction histidine kinase
MVPILLLKNSDITSKSISHKGDFLFLTTFTPESNPFTLKPFKRFISTVPPWALLFVLVVVVVNSMYLHYRSDSEVLWLLVGMYLITLLFSFGSTYILYKKPGDPAARVFFIYLQLFALASNAGQVGLPMQEQIAMFLFIAFMAGTNLSVAALIHFHLVFPRPSFIFIKYKWLTWVSYSIGGLLTIIQIITLFLATYSPSDQHRSLDNLIGKNSLIWLILAVTIALGLAVYQFKTIKSTLARNQVRIVIIGSLFGFITPITDGLFFDYIETLLSKNPWLLHLTHGPASLIMASCFTIAIFRYRIWGTEVFIRKALLYLSATFIIVCTYFFLIFFIDRLTSGETATTRFISLALSVLIFMVLRDKIQRLIQRLFHRESYDSATVVSDFEAKLSGIYHIDELSSGIVSGLDEIFHFKSFIFSLKKNDNTYQPVFLFGNDQEIIHNGFLATPGFENKLCKAKVFSPEELDKMPGYFEHTDGELIVPMLQSGQSFGFFLCGPKKSEKSYSLQDIRVLSLLARRTVALFHTASLYQKDLDRQLMLERERARISQDMHDDVGASLTRISMISDLVKNMTGIREDARQWLGQISGTSREVTEEMDQIIWALNPKNDNLDGLASYIRRFAFEYLEPTPIECIFDFPEEMPDKALSVEVRRNVYLVVREALHNVAKHSGATKVEISLVLNEHGFRIFIKDNGNGFETEKLEFKGNGLVNMKKRMNDIRGEFVIRSKVGKGTEIELTCLT